MAMEEATVSVSFNADGETGEGGIIGLSQGIEMKERENKERRESDEWMMRSQDYDILEKDPTAEAIAECDKYVLTPYRVLLRLLAWIPLKTNAAPCWKVIRAIHVAMVIVLILIASAAQIAVCFRRDGIDVGTVRLRNGTTVCSARDHVITNHVVLDVLLLLSYLFGVYMFSGGGDWEHLFSLASRTVLKYYHLKKKKMVKTIIQLIVVYLVFGVVWIILSFFARLMQAFGIGLFPTSQARLQITWTLATGSTTVPESAQIGVGVVCLVGFVIFDLIYLAAIVNYMIQSEFNVKFLSALTDMVKDKTYDNLDLAIKDVGEARSYLNILNTKTSFAASLVLFNIGIGVVIGLYSLNEITVAKIVKIDNNFHLALAAIAISTALWIVLAAVPFVQAARVTAACNRLKTSAYNTRTRPFQYSSTAQLDLDSFTLHISAIKMRAKMFGVPILPWVMYGVISAVLFMILIFFGTDLYHLFDLVV